MQALVFSCSSDDSRSPAVRVELHRDRVAHEHLDPMKTHLSRQVGKDSFSIRRLYAKESVGQSFLHRGLNDLCLLLVYHTKGQFLPMG